MRGGITLLCVVLSACNAFDEDLLRRPVHEELSMDAGANEAPVPMPDGSGPAVPDGSRPTGDAGHPPTSAGVGGEGDESGAGSGETGAGSDGGTTEDSGETACHADTDGDGTPDCDDGCIADPEKTAPGACGCGVVDTDTDADSTPDCDDACPLDADKTVPGACGCGVADTDTDVDGTPDCLDSCPNDPNTTAACFPVGVSNFVPALVSFEAAPNSVLDCGTTTLNTTDPDGPGPQVATITNWCGTDPVPQVQPQPGGPEVVILPLRGLEVAAGSTLRLVGTRPVIFAVDGSVLVAGAIDASSDSINPGAGANWGCAPAPFGGLGAAGGGSCFSLGEGGGGGGFGSTGGQGGNGGSAGGCGIAAGVTWGNEALVPLLGGCPGGDGTTGAVSGGGGGGAFQLSVNGTLTVSGTLRANGAAGTDPTACSQGGGGGGGSGGGILLEYTTQNITGTIQVDGGDGGAGGLGAAGGDGAANQGASGSCGTKSYNGGGGGGGGYGRSATKPLH